MIEYVDYETDSQLSKKKDQAHRRVKSKDDVTE